MEPVVVSDDRDINAEKSGVCNCTSNIFSLLNEAESFRECDFANYVKAKAMDVQSSVNK